jgi:large subunit ribosomal protein L5
MSYTKELYTKSIPDLKKHFSYQNDMEIPKLKKISINVGIKAVDSDNKFLSYLSNQVTAIAGQKAVLTKSNKSIATFKLRENMAIGCMVTLRGKKMYEFFDRLIYIALPRIRDFRGLSSKGFNQSGHYSFGLKEHNVFLEVDLDNVLKIFGMNITIVTDAKTKEESIYLLRKLNLPIK